jgi:glycosyltransferase involved in cell wall biosynthesis
MYRSGEMKKYDIVHFNNTENFLLFQKQAWQISIAESHGFDFWVNYRWLVKDEKNIVKYILWNIFNFFVWWKIRRKIQEFDLYYCSTPDMLEPLRQKVRADVKWLPNPINTDIFQPQGDIIQLEWNPACFFPTRLHGDKKPEYAIDIFQNYIKPNYPEATLHLLNQWFEVSKYKKVLSDETTYFWHDFMDKETLAAKVRGSDFCFWDFSIGGLSLMPMQIMACKKPIVTYDMYELIKVPRQDLWELTRKLFEDEDFKKEYIERNYQYIMHFHTEKSIAKMHLENLRPFIEN